MMEEIQPKEEKIYKPGDPWETFPPNRSDEERIKGYERNKRLFNGEHAEVFAKAKDWVQKKLGTEQRLYIACNFPRVVSTLIADLLFGEPLRICMPENRAVQERLREIASETNLQSTLYDSALSGSYRGGAVLKACWSSKGGVSIATVPSQYYFPHPDPDDMRHLLGSTIAWLRRDGNKTYLRREIHEPGKVKQELWLMEGDKPKEKVPLTTLGITLKESLDTHCPTPLVEYIPNTRLDDDMWGESDYLPIERPLEALNERISHLHRVLDVHSEPLLVVPKELLRPDQMRPRERYEYERSNETAIGATDKEVADIVRYVTWDAHLTAAFSEIERLLDILMICAEITPDMFGMGKGGVAESGRALKIRWARQLAKRQRREMVYDAALRRLLKNAAILDASFGGGPSVKDTDKVSLLWGDGLPNDPKETAEEESLYLASGISSKRSSYVRAFQAEEEDADREMAQILKERSEEMSMFLKGSVDDGEDANAK